MKKQLLSILTVSAMAAGSCTVAIAKNEKQNVQPIKVGEATVVSAGNYYSFHIDQASFVSFLMPNSDASTGSNISVSSEKTNYDVLGGGDGIRAYVFLPAGNYYVNTDTELQSDSLTISATALNTLPVLKSGKTYKGTLNDRGFLVYRYKNKRSTHMTLTSQTKKSLKPALSVSDGDPDTQNDGAVEVPSKYTNYYIKGGTNYVIYTQEKAGAYSLKATAKAFKETAKETVKHNNDSYKTASSLKLSKNYYGAVHEEMDPDDYYKLTLKKKKKVTISLKAKHGNYIFYTKKGAKSGKAYKGLEYVNKTKKVTLKPGTYYVDVQAQGSGSTYCLKVK